MILDSSVQKTYIYISKVHGCPRGHPESSGIKRMVINHLIVSKNNGFLSVRHCETMLNRPTGRVADCCFKDLDAFDF